MDIQSLIDNAISDGTHYVKIPDGVYKLDKGLVVGKRDFSFLESFVIEGTVPAYGGAAGVKIIVPKDSFGLAFQRCKGFRCRNIAFEGANILYAYGENQVMFDENMDWTNGCRSSNVSPHAGIVVDPFLIGRDQYPGFEDWYLNENQGGSTDGVIEGVSIRYFVDGFADQPSGMRGNGDCITIRDSWVDYCKYAFSTGNNQNRSVILKNIKSWGGVHTFINTRYTGSGMGCPPSIDGANIAGSMRYLCNLHAFSNNNGITFNDVHTEMLSSIGGCDTPAGKVNINSSWINLVPGRDIMFRGDSITFNQSTVTNYGFPYEHPMTFDVRKLSITDTDFDTPPMLANKMARGRIFTNRMMYRGFPISDNCIISINEDSNDAVEFYVPGQNNKVEISSNYKPVKRITITNKEGFYDNGYLRRFLPNICTGKTSEGSLVIEKVSLDGEWKFRQFEEGVQLTGPCFSDGTLIKSYSTKDGTVTISKPAIKTGTFNINGVEYTEQ